MEQSIPDTSSGQSEAAKHNINTLLDQYDIIDSQLTGKQRLLEETLLRKENLSGPLTTLRENMTAAEKERQEKGIRDKTDRVTINSAELLRSSPLLKRKLTKHYSKKL